MTDETLLQTRSLTKEFRGFRAVDDVDLVVQTGTVHALVGPNGAGKTTLFNLLTGFLSPTSGTDRVRRAGHHRQAARGDRPPGDRPVLPDHQPLRRPHPARAPRARAGQPHRPGYAVLAVGDALRPVRRPRHRAARAGGPRRPVRPAGRLPRVRAEAGPRAGPRPGPRPPAAPPRRAHRRHGHRGRRPHHRPRQAGRRGPDRRPRRPQHARRRVAGRHRHRAPVRPGPRRGPLRAGAPGRPGHRGLPRHSHRTWPMADVALAVESLSAWYGEARALTDVSLDVAAGRGRHPRRPQRRRQDHPAALRDGPAPAVPRDSVCVDGVDVSSRAGRRPRPGRARMGARRPRDLREPHRRGEPRCCRPWSTRAPGPSTACMRRSRSSRSARTSRARSSPAASSRCSPSPGCCGWAPGCCCSTSRARGSRRSSCSGSARSSARSPRHGVAVLLVEQNVTFASTVADRHVLLAQGRVVERLDNDEFAQRKGELLELPRHLTGTTGPPCTHQTRPTR